MVSYRCRLTDCKICAIFSSWVDYLQFRCTLFRYMATAIEFTAEELEICKTFTKNSYQLRNLAKSLLTKLREKGVITDDDTFSNVKSNLKLMNAISKSIVLGLNTNIASSRYGLKVVSDFDLHANMATDMHFNDFLGNIKFDKNRPEYKTLMTNRANLRRFVNRVKNSVVVAFELPETPDSREVKPVRKKIKCDISKDMGGDISTATVTGIDDEAEEATERRESIPSMATPAFVPLLPRLPL